MTGILPSTFAERAEIMSSDLNMHLCVYVPPLSDASVLSAPLCVSGGRAAAGVCAPRGLCAEQRAAPAVSLRPPSAPYSLAAAAGNPYATSTHPEHLKWSWRHNQGNED